MTEKRAESKLERFMDEIRSTPVPAGFGLLTSSPSDLGSHVIQINDPAVPLPLPLEDWPMTLVIVDRSQIAYMVKKLNAQPAGAPGWWRFAMWEGNEYGS